MGSHLHLEVDGDSGSWVVRNGQICGFIVSRTIDEPWAYMLPIEQVFEDIQVHLESTWKDRVSPPQTWLGGAAQSSNHQSSLPVRDLDRHSEAHINGRQGRIVLPQGDTDISVEKLPEPATIKTPASQASFPTDSPIQTATPTPPSRPAPFPGPEYPALPTPEMHLPRKYFIRGDFHRPKGCSTISAGPAIWSTGSTYH